MKYCHLRIVNGCGVRMKKKSSTPYSGYFHLRSIGGIGFLITADMCRTIVRSMITPRLDHGNTLLYIANSVSLQKWQKLINTAARLVTRSWKHEHTCTSSILIFRHWLSVTYRTKYKGSFYIFNVLYGYAPT